MANYATRKATMQDVDALVEIESSAVTGLHYFFDDRFFFIEEQGNRGEMTIALAGDEPVGMGQFSIMPDGTGWLECLRVKKEWWRQGVGKAIYDRYLMLAEKYHTPGIAMYTGNKNVSSRKLAELYGLSLAAEFDGYTIKPEGPGHADPAFELVTEAEQIERLMAEDTGWGPFMNFNHTFMHFGRDLCRYIAERKACYSDGKNHVVLGCRMLEDRGWFLGWMSGDFDQCIRFAEEKAKEARKPSLECLFPPEREDLKAAFEKAGWEKGGGLIVMERMFENKG